jgi:hypothetical protein
LSFIHKEFLVKLSNKKPKQNEPKHFPGTSANLKTIKRHKYFYKIAFINSKKQNVLGLQKQEKISRSQRRKEKKKTYINQAWNKKNGWNSIGAASKT